MKKKPSLYLIDGSAYIFRAFYGVRHHLTNSKGMPTNALYGFTTMLMKVVREEGPDYLAVIFDTKEKTFRHDLFPEYKANRGEPPEDLKAQFPYFKELVDCFNITTLSREGYEADDIIGTLARQGERNGMHVVIVSGDKDMMQLVGPDIVMLDTMKNKTLGEAEVEEKFGVKPERVIEVLGLMGDSSDNVPGVAGVGPKTAADLIQKYGSMAGLYEKLDSIDKKKLKEKLEIHKDNAFLSRKLVTIDTEMTLDCEIKDMVRRDPDIEKMRILFEELEFNTLLNELPDSESTQVPEVMDTKYEAVLTEKQLDALIKELKKAGKFAVDLETTGIRPVWARIVGLSFSIKEGSGWYIPVGHQYLGAPVQLNKQMVMEKLKPLLEDPKLFKFGHNIKYDLIVLKNEGVGLQGIDFDSMLAAYVLDPTRRNYSMDALSLELLNRKTIHYEDVAGKGAKQIGFDEVSIESATDYAAEDADVTLQLTQKLKPQLKDAEKKLFEEIEMPLIDVLASMELTGIKLNQEHLGELSKVLKKDMAGLEKEIHLLAEEEFNVNSPKQLAVILFEKLNLPVVKKTKTGFSTDVKVLEELASKHPLPDKILTYRQMAKLKSTYVDSLPGEIFEKTGRVHTSYNQTVAATGRLSSSDPNLQNIPIRTKLGKEIRKAFVADEGCELLAADYSQIELRVLAHLSNDPALVQAFEKGEDIHTRTAAEIFGTSLDEVGEDSRRIAKAVNFGIVYGLSAFGLSRQLKISPKEAKTFIEKYFELYKNVKQFMESTIEQVRGRGYSTTLLDRRRYLPDIHSKNRQLREATERIAINSPVQGSAADLIKIAMIRLHQHLNKNNFKSRMILQVHDELVFECPSNEKNKLEKLVRKEMEGVFKLKVPLVVDMAWGQNWRDAK
ncbi:MAG: DNA polymerase I [Candidatus Nitronauta litoralis]|uniref:DNA polymerase I n=1 Tax=Candidatus Nitronauta litoralis TaxID=2705533 RepID=A0A7T0BZ49_9BACT|nr:MAG: DNA polymerase I [Candidatus Nitronauta litoralis]